MERRSALLLGELFHARVQGFRQRLHPGVRRGRISHSTIVITGHQQWLWQIAVFFQPVVPVPTVARGRLITGVLFDKVAVAWGVEPRTVVVYQRRVDVPQRLQHLSETPAVENQVMSLTGQPVLIRSQTNEAEAEQRTAIERIRAALRR